LGAPGTMASAERERITGAWGRSPQRGPGAEPLVGESGGETRPPDAESFDAIVRLKKSPKLVAKSPIPSIQTDK